MLVFRVLRVELLIILTKPGLPSFWAKNADSWEKLIQLFITP